MRSSLKYPSIWPWPSGVQEDPRAGPLAPCTEGINGFQHCLLQELVAQLKGRLSLVLTRGQVVSDGPGVRTTACSAASGLVHFDYFDSAGVDLQLLAT